MPTSMMQKTLKQMDKANPVSTDEGGTFIPPPPAGSFEELAETILRVGWPGAFGASCRHVEQLIQTRLFWES